MTSFQLKVLAAILAVLLSSGILYAGYSYVKNIGYQEAQAECTEKFDAYNKSVEEKIGKLQTSVATMAEELITQNQSMASDIITIARNTKNKGPTTTIVEGKCIPSATFVEGLNEAITRANKR